MKLTESQLMELKPIADALDAASMTGGYAHVVWDDGNLQKCFIESALQDASEGKYPGAEDSKDEAIALLNVLLRLTFHQRKQFYFWWNEKHFEENREKYPKRTYRPCHSGNAMVAPIDCTPPRSNISRTTSGIYVVTSRQ